MEELMVGCGYHLSLLEGPGPVHAMPQHRR